MIFYVYALYRDVECLQPFYVGKGKGIRMHEHEILRKHDRNPFKKNVIRKCIAELGMVPKKIIHQNLEEAEAFLLEKHWIAYWGRRDLGTGCLTNLTDGGEGTSGVVYTAEQCAANGAKRRGKPGAPWSAARREKMRLLLTGIPKTAEHREALRQALLGRAPPPLARIRGIEVNTGRIKSPETCARLSAAHKGKTRTAEHSLAISLAKKGTKQDPEVVARQVASRAITMAGRPGPNTGRVFSAEVRAKMSASQLARSAREKEEARG